MTSNNAYIIISEKEFEEDIDLYINDDAVLEYTIVIKREGDAKDLVLLSDEKYQELVKNSKLIETVYGDVLT